MDLSLVPLDELLDELEGRMDQCVVVGRRMLDPEEREFGYRRRYKGNVEDVVYLLRHCEWWLHKDYNETERNAESWEEL